MLTDELLAGNAAPENCVQSEHEAPFLYTMEPQSQYFGSFLSYSFCAKMWSMEAAPGPAISSVNNVTK